MEYQMYLKSYCREKFFATQIKVHVVFVILNVLKVVFR